MDELFTARKQLKKAGIFDLACAIFALIFILTIAIRWIIKLFPDPNRYDTDRPDPREATLAFYKITICIFVPLMIICCLLKVLFAALSLIKFFEFKSTQHIYAALIVIFLPVIGGIVAIVASSKQSDSQVPRSKVNAPHKEVEVHYSPET